MKNLTILFVNNNRMMTDPGMIAISQAIRTRVNYTFIQYE